MPAIDFSIGAGTKANGLFTRYTLKADGELEGEKISAEMSQKMNQVSYGALLFLDATWAVLSVGIQHGFNNFDEAMVADSPSIDNIENKTKGTGSELMLTFALSGKYPVSLSEKLIIFPLIGIEYQIALIQSRTPEGRSKYNRTDEVKGDTDSNGNTYRLPAWNSLFVVVGTGLDIRLSSSLFLRTEVQYGFRLMTPYEKDSVVKAKNGLNADNPKMRGLTSGPSLLIAVRRQIN